MLELSEKSGAVAGSVPCGEIYVDGLGVGDVGSEVLRDRQNLAANGIIVVAITVDKVSGDFLAGPEIITRGFIYVKDSPEVMRQMERVVISSLMDAAERRVTDSAKIKSMVKSGLDDYLWKNFQRRPAVIPVILEA